VAIHPLTVPLADPDDSARVLGRDFEVPLDPDFRFRSGAASPDRVVRARLYGPEDAPLVIVAGGISAGRIPYAPDGSGWWPGIVGPGAAVDLNGWRVLAFDFAPLADAEVAVAPADQAGLAGRLLDHLGIGAAHAWIGASYGGMAGLAFAAEAPRRLGRLCVISAAHRPSAMGVAWRGVQRRIVAFAREAGRPGAGLALARQLAMSTYRSPEEFAARFHLEADAEGLTDLCRYLVARGEAYPGAMPAGRWLSLSASIDGHRVEPEAVDVPVTLVASDTDRLVPLDDMAELARRLPRLERFARLTSLYGHDAFLKDVEPLTPLLKTFLTA
jgi:homoserine O-acetyltransferase